MGSKMATFNTYAFDGENGVLRDGILYPEIFSGQLGGRLEDVRPEEVSRGIIVGAQYRPLQIAKRSIVMPRNRGQVAWQGDSSPITRQSNKGLMYAASVSVHTERTDADGTRFLIVAPREGEKAVMVLVQTGLSGNAAAQEDQVLSMLRNGQQPHDHGAYALDGGARGLIRKIRTAITRAGGYVTRVSQLIEIQPSGGILVAGMLNENAVFRLVNNGGKLRKVDAGENPRKLFATLRSATRNTDREDEMPRAEVA